MSDERAFAARPGALWRVAAGGLGIAAAAVAAAILMHEPAEQLADLVAPWPFLVLMAASLLSMLLAWMRGTPFGTGTSGRLALWWLTKFAFLAALIILLAAWIIPFFVGLAIARALFQAFLLVLLLFVLLTLVGTIVTNAVRAFRGS